MRRRIKIERAKRPRFKIESVWPTLAVLVVDLPLHLSRSSAMAASLTRLGSLTLRHTCRITSRRKASPPATFPFRTFLTTPIRREDKFSSSKEFKFDYNDLEPEDKAEYDSLSPEEKIEYQEEAAAMVAEMNSPEVESELNAEIAEMVQEMAEEPPPDNTPPDRPKPGLMAMGEMDEQDIGEDEEFKGDDISSLAHGELEQHREIREMARIAAWEMPLLSSTFSPSIWNF